MSHPDPSESALSTQHPTHFRRYVFVLGCGTSLLLYLHRYTFALIKPKLQTDLGLKTGQLGYLDSVFSGCYSLFQLPAGVLCDLSGVHWFLGGIILLWSLALFMHGLAGGTVSMAWARALFGLGQAGCFASIARMTKTWFPVGNRTTVQGWMGVFFGRTGGLTANLLVGAFMLGVLQMPWRTTVFVLAGMGIVYAIVFVVFFRNSPRKHPSVNQAEADLIEGSEVTLSSERLSLSERLRGIPEMFRRMSPRSILNLMCLNLASMMSTIADNIYSNWIPLFLFQSYGLKFKEMGIYSALPLLGGALGGVAGGYLNDYFIKRSGNRRWSRSLIGAFGKGVAAILLFRALVLYFDDPLAFCTMLFFVKFFADMSLATRWGTVTDIGGKATASVFAFNNAVAGIGAVLAPTMYGIVAETTGWFNVFLIAIAAYVLCSIAWLTIDCTRPLVKER